MVKKKVAIAGASGFIGRWFMEKYCDTYDIIALSRSEVSTEAQTSIEWRKVDLYSLGSTREALAGADYALYLVHSMAPSTRLNQSTFEDTDLLLADNFARAAQAVSLKQIVFIGGIIPTNTSNLSRHLRSRLETENTLASRKVPVTTLRAGIVIGPGGSSFQIVKKLTERLPVMACPKWCLSPSQPIDIEDILGIIDQSFQAEAEKSRTIEVGGPEIITYMDLLRITSKKLKKRRLIFSIPFFTLGLSKLWVSIFSESSTTFVSPLIESLRHHMIIETNDQEAKRIGSRSIRESVENALKTPAPKLPGRKRVQKEKNTVRSVQRLPNPANKSVQWVAEEYPQWISRTFVVFLKAKAKDNGHLVFDFLGIKLLELQFVEDSSDEQRQLFYIIGGILAKRTNYGWLEFRSVLDNQFIIAAIHEFVPRLPWTLYKYTQAVVHLWIMRKFGAYLKSLSRS